MKTLRLTRITLQVVFVAVLSLSMILTGCTYTQVQDTLTVAAEVANSAAAIISPVSPELGEYVAVVGKTLKDVSQLYAAYHSAAEADKPGILGKLHAALGTITANLRTILDDAHIKAPAKVAEITVFVQIVNSAVQLILNHLPQGPPAVHAQAQALPVVKNAKSAQDLASAWNNAIGAEHPEAVVSAPKHRKLGIF